mgnify:FL=1
MITKQTIIFHLVINSVVSFCWKMSKAVPFHMTKMPKTSDVDTVMFAQMVDIA